MTPLQLLFLEGLIVLAVAISAALVHAFIQRRFRYEQLSRHNDVAGFLFSAVGVIYAVVLGFVVVVVWEKFDAAQDYVSAEVSAVADLYRTAGALPAPVSSAVRRDLREYITIMATREWTAMAHGAYSREGAQLLEKAGQRINVFDAKTSSQSDVHQLAMQQVTRLFDARRLRLRQNESSVPPILWFALVAGAAAMLAFAYIFGVQDLAAQRIMTGILAGIIAIMFLVILEFDQPYSGAVAVAPDGWITLLSRLNAIP